jgi:hypothetical protein
MHEIGAGDDVDQDAARHRRHALDAIAFHQLDDALDRSVLVHSLDVGGRHLADLVAVRMGVLLIGIFMTIKSNAYAWGNVRCRRSA